eukprot:5006614-Prymnesium_polylepis.1
MPLPPCLTCGFHALTGTASLERQGGVLESDDAQTKKKKKGAASFGGEGVGSEKQAVRGTRHTATPTRHPNAFATPSPSPSPSPPLAAPPACPRLTPF